MAADNELYVDHLGLRPLTWKRPEGPPRVWRVVDGRRKTESGKIPRFSIQEVPKELVHEVTEFMTQSFLREEPTAIGQGLVHDTLAIREYRTLWREAAYQGISVVALEVNSNPAAKPVIAGANILHVLTAEDVADTKFVWKLKSKSMKEILRALNQLSNEADALRKYDVDKYLHGVGLSVDPSFRGQGLGEELLRVRDDIGRVYKIPMSETVFTATASQILASRVGYEVLIERKYSELLDDEGKVAFPGVPGEFMKVMAKRLY